MSLPGTQPIPGVDLETTLRAAAAGTFPAADGGVSRAAPWRVGVEAVIALTGHAVLVVGEDVPDERLHALGVDGFGGAHAPRTALDLAGRGEIGILDALLVAHGTGGASAVVERVDLARSPRARHADQWRTEVRVYGLPDPARTALATLGRGIGGLLEVGVEATDGSADTLLEGVLALVPAGEVLLASVSPGNARSLRFFLRHGFRPIGSVQQWHPDRRDGALIR
ncbi:N-acetyltransferase [Ornithinimicrobium cavernae]|uniref:N-acetyltransferase n=1 Tax=Ornithinimicrobium cavernae TaxID=2666047 RepID=UPI000D696380|nr:N-acetyltransferase [Ornithinimicrobium cavernae]